jgi:drug/metabolite transporter (DMT)-like permease
MHALWNALISHAQDKALYTVSLHLCSALIALPVLLWVGLPLASSYPYLLVSIVLHGVYIYLLSKVYEAGAFAPAYIVMRGAAPVLVAVLSFWFLDDHIGLPALAGLLVVVAGLFLMLYSYSRNPIESFSKSQFKFAIINALVIAAYTVVDGLGVRQSGNAVAYVFASALFDPILAYYFGFRKSAMVVIGFARANWALVVLGSIISLGGYTIVLWAMTMAPIAIVSGLRETSVVFAAIISVFWFKEGRWLPATLSAAVVLCGLILLKGGF